ncbi:class I SAM-dependent methyltransferase [Mangrovibacter plantisponsor]|uniref:Methyltransferase family protein n=1 Tax=Mangrovibacter plantisponsor TaxID=451513 RepID=A0A317Q6A0_9ENTR|nr:class I SAM-dependent methyltransferase [Mangrovibacter plantisponsor]PWW11739.1 methyltransferase family protein [Mangrovibacter plantisponsor]
MKQNKYDDAAFFDKYAAMARSVEGLSAAGEWPAFKAMLPPLAGKQVLDLGCGYGWHCFYAQAQGASAITGVDISEKMLARAQQAPDSASIFWQQAAMEDYHPEPEAFDVVLSSLAFHYVADWPALCRKVVQALKPGGTFVFSVEHPVFTAEGGQAWHCDNEGKPLHWPVDHYFSTGRRETCFLGESVVKYHRTLTDWLAPLLALQLHVNALCEPQPPAHLLATVPGMQDELRRPMMLMISVSKPA